MLAGEQGPAGETGSQMKSKFKVALDGFYLILHSSTLSYHVFPSSISQSLYLQSAVSLSRLTLCG